MGFKRVLILLMMGSLVACKAGFKSNPFDQGSIESPPTDGFFVSTDGDDSADGTVDAPLATIQQAIVKMRNSTMKKTYVRGGIYSLNGATIVLGAQDNDIELVNYPGETPTISGGYPITASWTLEDAVLNIWSASLPAGVSSVGTVTVNGEAYDTARTPNRDPSDRQARSSWFVAEASLGPPPANPWDPSFSTDDAFTYRAGDLPLSMNINGEPDAWVLIWDRFGWAADILKINSVDHTARSVDMQAASQFGIGANSRYFVYGIRSGLDVEGEYYFDQANNKLLVIPKIGTMLSISNVVISTYNGGPLIEINGADGVRIAGFDMRDQHNTGRWGVSQGGGVHITAGNDAIIENNTFHALGVGVAVEDGNDNNTIRKNEAYDIGNTGMYMYGDNNVMIGNYIHDVGLVEQNAKGILTGPGRNIISHNRIENVPHYGIIAVGDEADGLIIEYNTLKNINQGTNDGGVIYLKNRGNYNASFREQVRYNRIEGTGGLHVDETTTNFTSWTFTFGIYLDEGQSGTDVYGNIFINNSYGAVFPHNGTDNYIYNNVIVDPVNTGLFLESNQTPSGNVYENNIFYSSSAIPMIMVKYGGQEHTFTDNLFYNSANPSYFSASFMDYSDATTDLNFADAAAAGFHTGSIDSDPLFVDAANGDYRLQPGSPAFSFGFVELPYSSMGPDGAP